MEMEHPGHQPVAHMGWWHITTLALISFFFFKKYNVKIYVSSFTKHKEDSTKLLTLRESLLTF